MLSHSIDIPCRNTRTMQKVADHMNLKPCKSAQFSQFNSMASATVANHLANQYMFDGLVVKLVSGKSETFSLAGFLWLVGC
jgi:hypothetical protein